MSENIEKIISEVVGKEAPKEGGEYSYDMELPDDWKEVGLAEIREFIRAKFFPELSMEDLEWKREGKILKFREKGGKRCL